MVGLVPRAPPSQLRALLPGGGEHVGDELAIGGKGVLGRHPRLCGDPVTLTAAGGARRPRRGAADDHERLPSAFALPRRQRGQLLAHAGPADTRRGGADAAALRQVEVGAVRRIGLQRRPVDDQAVVRGTHAGQRIAPLPERRDAVRSRRPAPHERRVELRDAELQPGLRERAGRRADRRPPGAAAGARGGADEATNSAAALTTTVRTGRSAKRRDMLRGWVAA